MTYGAHRRMTRHRRRHGHRNEPNFTEDSARYGDMALWAIARFDASAAY